MDNEKPVEIDADQLIQPTPEEEAALAQELENITAQIQQGQVQRPTTMLDVLQSAQLPPNGAQIQIHGCQGCGQPLLLAIGQTLTGQFVAMPYCFNSNCPAKQQRIMPAGPNPLDIRRRLGL